MPEFEYLNSGLIQKNECSLCLIPPLCRQRKLGPGGRKGVTGLGITLTWPEVLVLYRQWDDLGRVTLSESQDLTSYK